MVRSSCFLLSCLRCPSPRCPGAPLGTATREVTGTRATFGLSFSHPRKNQKGPARALGAEGCLGRALKPHKAGREIGSPKAPNSDTTALCHQGSHPAPKWPQRGGRWYSVEGTVFSRRGGLLVSELCSNSKSLPAAFWTTARARGRGAGSRGRDGDCACRGLGSNLALRGPTGKRALSEGSQRPTGDAPLESGGLE